MSGAAERLGIRRGKALVVDDDPAQQLLLSIQLGQEGFEIVTASNGVEAIQCFVEESPDIVFMDVMMPVMDGYEATREIKSLSGDRFVPVIFLSALEEDVALVQGIACGGDDFLHKPSSPCLLSAKIAAFERISGLYSMAHRQRSRIEQLHAQLLREQELAEQLFSRVISMHREQVAGVEVLMQPATTFSGDLMLMAHRPDGGVHVFLGDSTGHGLSAAIPAVPVSEVFYALTTKGFSGVDILDELNRKLCRLLPTGMFMAAALVSIDETRGEVYIWNCGMPDVLVMRGATVVQAIASQMPPLGIVDEVDALRAVAPVSVQGSDRIVLYSDGVIEASAPSGESFGVARLVEVLTRVGPSGMAACVLRALTGFCHGRPFEDDVSLVEVRCDQWALKGVASDGDGHAG